jgi:hypothetical protein
VFRTLTAAALAVALTVAASVPCAAAEPEVWVLHVWTHGPLDPCDGWWHLGAYPTRREAFEAAKAVGRVHGRHRFDLSGPRVRVRFDCPPPYTAVVY